MTTITTDHIKKMRAAMSHTRAHNVDTWIVVDWRMDREGERFAVEVASRIDHGEGHEPRDTRLSSVNITCEGEIDRYNGRPTKPDVFRYVATQTHYYTERKASVLRSLCNTLRAGDELYVHFVIGNTTQTIQNVQFGVDECYVSIRRKNQCVATFLVDYIATPMDGYSMRDTLYRLGDG